MATNGSITPFHHEIESITEFLERFKVQNSAVLQAEGTSEQQQASLLCRALPVNVITNVQRRIKPTNLSEAT